MPYGKICCAAGICSLELYIDSRVESLLVSCLILLWKFALRTNYDLPDLDRAIQSVGTGVPAKAMHVLNH